MKGIVKGRIPMKKGMIIYCNMCGKEINRQDGIPTGDGLHVEKHWGYFSKKDGEIHTFDLCETCYDQLTDQFVIPTEIQDETVFI